MFIPEIRVSKLQIPYNARLICRYLSPEKANNKTRPFIEKTYMMYPELTGVADIQDNTERNNIINAAVEKRLNESSDEINLRIDYFTEKFKTFIYGFIEAMCNLYNYQWSEKYPYINCYVGYIPFYPRSDEDKWFYVSYNDEERVFSGAVHEINHMIFWEKWKEMNNVNEIKVPMFPSPLWFLEEMIVDPTLNDESVKGHTLYENKAYEQFYSLMVDGESIIAHLRKLYSDRKNIEEFITKAYEFTEKNIELLKSY